MKIRINNRFLNTENKIDNISIYISSSDDVEDNNEKG